MSQTDHEESDPAYIDENFWVLLIIACVTSCVLIAGFIYWMAK